MFRLDVPIQDKYTILSEHFEVLYLAILNVISTMTPVVPLQMLIVPLKLVQLTLILLFLVLANEMVLHLSEASRSHVRRRQRIYQRQIQSRETS